MEEDFKNKLVLLNYHKFEKVIFGMRGGGRFTSDFVSYKTDDFWVTSEKDGICEVIPFADGIGLYNCIPAYIPKEDLSLVNNYTMRDCTWVKRIKRGDYVFLDPRWSDDLFGGRLWKVYDVTSLMIRIGSEHGEMLHWIQEIYFRKQENEATYKSILRNYVKKVKGDT